MSKKALLIVDMQVGMFDESNPVFQGEILLKKVEMLISSARYSNIPVLYIQHTARVGKPLEHGKPGWAIHPSIAPNESEIVIQKETPDSFNDTNLQNELKSNGVSEMYIAGIQSEICIDTTCRRAYSLGYKVTLISDAHSTWNSSYLEAPGIIEHHNSVLKWFADVKNCEEVVKTFSNINK